MSTVSPPAPAVRKSLHRWFYLGAFVLLIIATPLGYRCANVWLRERELAAIYVDMDAQDPNWRWPDLVASFPAPPPDEQNAALQVLKVRDPVARSTFRQEFLKNATDHPNVRLSEKNAKAIRESFTGVDPGLLDEARKLKDLPEGRFHIKPIENPFDPTYDTPFQGKILDVNWFLFQDAMRRADDGDTEAAAESYQALLHMTKAFNDAPGLMPPLLRLACQVNAINGVERTLGHGSVSEKRLKELQAAFAHEAEFNGLYHALRGERAFCHQGYVLISEGKIPYPPQRRRTGWAGWIDDLFPAYALGDHPDELRWYNGVVGAAKLDDESGTPMSKAVQAKFPDPQGQIAQFVVPFVTTMATDHLISRARFRCGATAVAAERYRLAHGRWPEDATELVKAGLLKAIYQDPFDGQPLRWKRTPTGLIIYSVGPDRTDNDGKLNRRSNSPIPSGGDVGFELWLPSFRGLPAPLVAGDLR